MPIAYAQSQDAAKAVQSEQAECCTNFERECESANAAKQQLAEQLQAAATKHTGMLVHIV
jgi:hypothetical protein